MKSKFVSFLRSRKGGFGVKEIAITVAVIIVIGAAIGIIKSDDYLAKWIADVWDYLFGRVKDLAGESESIIF